jgi:hypothetical protein
MARGFESKMVEFNQEEAARGRAAKPETSPADRERVSRRRALELARTRAAADLERATAPAHQQMLREAIAALDGQLKTL